MPTYFVTGKLGAGKTLACVDKIKQALIEGRPVATNLDIRLEKLVGKKAKNIRLYRLPDKPTAEDFYALGSGNLSYDEEKNGLLILDECGTWFNARDWNDKGRKGLIDYLIHMRKWGWDGYFLVQDIGAVDKQARKSVAEHVVYCRRMDRMSIPIADSLWKLVFDKKIPKKKLHVAIVKYGDLPHSPIVDRWWYTGEDLYPAYDTKQIFRDDYSNGLYTVLPPYYTHGRYAKPLTLERIMRITRIYMKKWNRVALIALAGVVGITAAHAFGPSEPDPVLQVVEVPVEKRESPDAGIVKIANQPQEDHSEKLREKFSGMVVQGVALDQNRKPIYVEIGNRSRTWNLDTLRSAGYEVLMSNQCQVTIMTEDRSDSVTLHTSYCPPDNVQES